MAFEERYCLEELDYFRQMGKLMAKEKPWLARFLAEKEGDPDVERLMEAFALLSGGLRQKLEDGFPEFTHGIIRMLWPNYLRPVPAMTVIEYRPKSRLKKPVQVCRDALIRSRTTTGSLSLNRGLLSDSQSTRPPSCHFTLARDLWLQPLHIRDIRNNSTLKKGCIEIDFFADSGVSPNALDLNKLSFWLGNDDDYTRYQLYLWFSECLMDAELVSGECRVPLPDLWLDPAGFEREDALLPWPERVHNGYRVLHEYFCFPESFFFFHLRGVVSLPDDFPLSHFTLRLHFCDPLSGDVKLDNRSLRLYCTPAVNLFMHTAELIRPDGRALQYPLLVSRRRPDVYDIFRVASVSCHTQASEEEFGKGKNRQMWPEFESFDHQTEFSDQRKVVYWQHRTKNSLLHRGTEHTVAFIHADGSQPDPSLTENEVVTAELVCTNRMLPEQLHPGDVCVAVGKNPAVASFSNVTRPTCSLNPVTDDDRIWSLISCMNLNYLSLLEREALIEILRTFDLPGIHHLQLARLSREKLDAIARMETKPIDWLFKGVPRRGLATTLWINPAPFVSEGEIYLLGAVLSQFFALYASTGSYHHLKIVNTESQKSWMWRNSGQHPLM